MPPDLTTTIITQGGAVGIAITLLWFYRKDFKGQKESTSFKDEAYAKRIEELEKGYREALVESIKVQQNVVNVLEATNKISEKVLESLNKR